MLVLPVQIGETTTITAPNGDTILVLMTEHRSSLDEPLLGFSVPKGYAVYRDRVKERVQPELEQITLYKVSSLKHQGEIIAAYEPDDVIRIYRKQYPDSEDIRLSEINTKNGNYWYARLTEYLLSRRKPPFIVERGNQSDNA